VALVILNALIANLLERAGRLASRLTFVDGYLSSEGDSGSESDFVFSLGVASFARRFNIRDMRSWSSAFCTFLLIGYSLLTGPPFLVPKNYCPYLHPAPVLMTARRPQVPLLA
jgi:hypothetical protein